MKKLLALFCVLSFFAGLLTFNMLDQACCNPGNPAPESTPTWTEPSDFSQPTQPSESSEPSISIPDTPVTKPSAPSEPRPSLTQVRLQVSQPDRWLALEGTYPALGIEVIITNEQPTMAILDQTGAVLSQNQLWIDLSGTTAYAQLIDWDLAAKYDGQCLGLPLEMECFGLICNNPLMASLGATTSDIWDFASLSQVAGNLTSQGVPAFAPMKSEDLCRIMMMIPEYFRGFLDLYLTNTNLSSSEEVSGLNAIMNQNAVLCVTSGSDLAQLNSNQMHQLGFLPLYLGGENVSNTSVCVTGSSFACIRADASIEEQQAAIALLNYLVTARDDGTVPTDQLQIGAPYRQASFSADPFQQLLRADLLTGKNCVNCPCVSEIPVTLIQALETYIQEPTDENWNAILMTPAPILD